MALIVYASLDCYSIINISAVLHVRSDSCVRVSRLPLAGQQRRADDLRHRAVRVSRHARRLRGRQDLQVIRGREVEEQRAADLDAVPRHRVRPLLRSEPGAVVPRILRRHPLLHAGGAAGALVRRLRAAHLRRRLLRVPEARGGAAGAHQPDPQADPGPVRLHPAHPRHHHGRGPPLRMHLHPIVLHPQQYLVQSDLLHVSLIL